MSITNQLREAIESGPKSRYRLWKETGVDKAALSRFVHGKAGLSSAAIDALADNLDLELAPKQPPPANKPKTTKRKRSPKPKR